MNDLGKQITNFRKKNYLTQAELGEKLNVTSQAVSKWENGLSEPDLDTVKKMCAIFGVSMDEFAGVETAHPQEQATTVTETPVQPTVEEEKEEKMPIIAQCERCGKALRAGELKFFEERIEHRNRSGKGYSTYIETKKHTYCADCNQKVLTEKKRKETQDRLTSSYSSLEDNKKSFRNGFIWGTVAGLLALAILFIAKSALEKYLGSTFAVILPILSCVCLFLLVSQCFWEGVVLEILEFFCRSFSMPGVIFSLDLDGIIWMITVKIGLAILSFILSAAVFLLGVAIASVCAIFTFPFSIKRMTQSRKNYENQIKMCNKTLSELK